MGVQNRFHRCLRLLYQLQARPAPQSTHSMKHTTVDTGRQQATYVQYRTGLVMRRLGNACTSCPLEASSIKHLSQLEHTKTCSCGPNAVNRTHGGSYNSNTFHQERSNEQTVPNRQHRLTHPHRCLHNALAPQFWTHMLGFGENSTTMPRHFQTRCELSGHNRLR
jgi:Fe-S cluster biogenesis protein NfuA